MKYLKNWGTGWGMWATGDVVNFIDNHDNQRGHGGGGGPLTHWEPKPYKVMTVRQEDKQDVKLARRIVGNSGGGGIM